MFPVPRSQRPTAECATEPRSRRVLLLAVYSAHWPSSRIRIAELHRRRMEVKTKELEYVGIGVCLCAAKTIKDVPTVYSETERKT